MIKINILLGISIIFLITSLVLLLVSVINLQKAEPTHTYLDWKVIQKSLDESKPIEELNFDNALYDWKTGKTCDPTIASCL